MSDSFIEFLYNRIRDLLNWGWHTPIYSGMHGSVSIMQFLLAISVVSVVSASLLTFAKTHTGDFVSMSESNRAGIREVRSFVRNYHGEGSYFDN